MKYVANMHVAQLALVQSLLIGSLIIHRCPHPSPLLPRTCLSIMHILKGSQLSSYIIELGEGTFPHPNKTIANLYER